MKTDIRIVANNTIMLYLLQISKYIFPLITFPYLTRVLQPEYYGIVTFANGVIVYFQLFIDFGFLQSATKDCSLFREDKAKLIKIVSSIVQAKIILGAMGFILLVLLMSFTEVFQKRELYIILAYIPVLLGIFNADYLFRGLEIMKIITYRVIASRIIYTILIFAFIHTSEQYLLIPVISAFGEIIILIWTWHYIKKDIGIKIITVSLSEIISAFRTSAIFFISSIASTAYSSTNIVVLGIIYNNTLLAQFGVAYALVNNIRSLFTPIADSMYPYMIQKRNYSLIRTILLILMPVILLGSIGLLFLAKQIILLMAGDSYISAIPIFKAFIPTIFITLPVYLLGFPVLGAMGHMKDANMSVIFAALYHILGLAVLYFIGNCTFISVAILTFTTELFVLIYRAVCIRRVKQI